MLYRRGLQWHYENRRPAAGQGPKVVPLEPLCDLRSTGHELQGKREVSCRREALGEEEPFGDALNVEINPICMAAQRPPGLVGIRQFRGKS